MEFLDDILKSNVDESAVNALVGSLESQLSGHSRTNAATLSSVPVTTQLAKLSTMPTSKISITNPLSSNKVKPAPTPSPYVKTESSSLLSNNVNSPKLIAPRGTTSAAATPRNQSKKGSTGIVSSTATKYSTMPSALLKGVMPNPSTSPSVRSILTPGARSQSATTAIASKLNRPAVPLSTTSPVTTNQTNPSTRYVARASMATNPRPSNPSLGSQPYSSIQAPRAASKSTIQGSSNYSLITGTRPTTTGGITTVSTAEVNRVLGQLKSFLDNLINGAPKIAQNNVKEIVQKLIVSSSFTMTYCSSKIVFYL